MAKQWHGGKGSDPRPFDPNKYAENWSRIFDSNQEWLDNPLEGDGVVHDKCGTPECCNKCDNEGVQSE